MPAKIKHVAIVSGNYRLLGEFYEKLFGMKGDSRGPAATAVTVSDGYVGLNINFRKPGRQAGLDHFGFEVDDVDTVYARVRDDYPSIEFLKRPGNRPFAGISTHDPAGNVFDLSQPGMENRRGLYIEASEEPKPNARHITHLQLRAVDPAALARFYADVFGLALREKPSGDPNFYLTDGMVTLVIAPWRITDYAGTGIERPALDHIGFEVESLEAFQADALAIGARNPALAPCPIGENPEGEARLKLFAGCRYGADQLADPDGVLIDVREAGAEVAT